MIEIDGSYHEGGGQILRTACVLSFITRQPCRVFNIRKGRKKPGLAHQHLLGVKALVQLCGAKIKGDELGSQEIEFYPNTNYQKEVLIEIPTAGSITLVLQALLPALITLDHPTRIIFKGGATDTFFSPTTNYFQQVFLKILGKMNVRVELKIKQRGFYPEGNAWIEVQVFPSRLKSISLVKRKSLNRILILSGASESLRTKRVAERQIAGAKQILAKLKLPIQEGFEYHQCQSTGSHINIIAQLENTIFGSDNLGKLGKSAESVGKEAALMFLKEASSRACLDKHMADQILIYMALAKKQSRVSVSEVTPHCQTNIWVIEKFLGRHFETKENLIVWKP
jgi:RNA 3'-phosphate cyclase